jgi:hypothetical protein
VSRQVQTEDVRKFTGRAGIGIFPLATGFTVCVEMDFIGLLGQMFMNRIESNWQSMKLNFVLQHNA